MEELSVSRNSGGYPSLGRRLAEVGWAFLPLGWIAFGGPQAHIALLQERFVAQRRWLDEQRFVELLGLGQGLPGPTSTQMVVAVGTARAGAAGRAAGPLSVPLAGSDDYGPGRPGDDPLPLRRRPPGLAGRRSTGNGGPGGGSGLAAGPGGGQHPPHHRADAPGRGGRHPGAAALGLSGGAGPRRAGRRHRPARTNATTTRPAAGSIPLDNLGISRWRALCCCWSSSGCWPG